MALSTADADAGDDDGIPDTIFVHDIRSGSLTNTGLVRFGGTTAANSCGTDPVGNRYPCAFIFNPDGTLMPATGIRTGFSPGSFIGGNSENFRGGRQFQLSPELDRLNVNLIGHYEISPAFVPFVEAKYSRTKTSGTGSSGPAFIQGGTLGDPAGFDPDGPAGPLTAYRNREQIRLDNPFLTQQARDVICAQRALSTQTCTNSTVVSVRENLLGLGARTEKATRETYRVVAGVRGDFNDDWNYEVSLNYGRLNEKTEILGNLNVQRFLLGMDAGVNPANGQIQCKSQFIPGAAIAGADAGPGPYGSGTDPNAAARLASDIAACVPVNPLGGQFSDAVRNYVLEDTVAVGKTKQFDAMAFVSGDTSQFLNLPGGPIGFVLGAEYRQDDLLYRQDPDIQLGYTFYNAIPTVSPPTAKVKEAFGELQLPLLKDKPFFHELEVSAAARVSDYTLGNTGTVWAYNGSAIWSPISGLRFRGNYGRSVRAPNQAELFFPPLQNFAPGFSDPARRSISRTALQTVRRIARLRDVREVPTRRSILAIRATIRPSRSGWSVRLPVRSSLQILSGGNPGLQAEKSDSWTLGVVATPAFVPGFRCRSTITISR